METIQGSNTVERSRPVMTAGLMRHAPERVLIEKPEFDLQLSSDVVANPEDVDKREELHKARNEIQQRYTTEVLDFISKLGIDVGIDVIRERLDKFTLVVAEKESPYFKAKEEQSPLGSAYYDPKDLSLTIMHEMAFKDGQMTEQGQSSIVHELLHAASNSLFVARNKNGLTEMAPITNGLKKHPRLRRFNEAVTCYLTEKILRDKASTTSFYKQDVELFEEILRVSGIPERVFLEAYFEVPDFNAAPGQRMPKWHSMQKALNEKFGPDFLRTLYDKYLDDSSRLESLKDGVYSLEELTNRKKFGQEFLEQRHENRGKTAEQTAMSGLFERFSKKVKLQKEQEIREKHEVRKKWNIEKRQKDL